MSARPIDEPHRVSSQLELLFDLTFVIAVAAATAQLAQQIADAHALGSIGSFLTIAISALVLLFALWWLYFLEPAGEALSARRERSYFWGYSHYGIFAALAALGAGLEVAVEQSGHHVEASHLEVTYAPVLLIATTITRTD